MKFKSLNDCQQIYIYNYRFRPIPSNQLGINFI